MPWGKAHARWARATVGERGPLVCGSMTRMGVKWELPFQTTAVTAVLAVTVVLRSFNRTNPIMIDFAHEGGKADDL